MKKIILCFVFCLGWKLAIADVTASYHCEAHYTSYSNSVKTKDVSKQGHFVLDNNEQTILDLSWVPPYTDEYAGAYLIANPGQDIEISIGQMCGSSYSSFRYPTHGVSSPTLFANIHYNPKYLPDLTVSINLSCTMESL